MLFGLKYYAELRSKFKGVLWRVEIAERGYSGASEEMTFDGTTPLQITWEKRGDEFYVPVKASEATINILCKENFHYLSLFTSDPRQFRVSILRNKQLYWRGFVTADLYSENFTAPPYQVSIKAVDGFNLLSSIPFRDLLGIGISGCCSLWRLLTACIDLLELDVDTADWMDLYAEGMDPEQSPLRQTYLDLGRLYYVYEEPTYRDILELCLRPFAGQIFQSNGALHIRRAVSLYQTSRPVSFYRVGTEYPIGRIVTGGGLRLVIHSGAQVVTSASRERIDGMWTGDLHVLGESTLDIVPALRKVAVSVKNKALNNLIDHLGFYNLTAWTDPYGFLFQNNATAMTFCGDDDYQGVEITTRGVPVEQCNYPLTLEFGLQTYHSEWRAGSYNNPNTAYTVAVHYGVRIVGENATWSLTPSGIWVQGSYEITSEVKTGNEESVKIEMQGIPIDGEWQFFFRQTLIGKVTYYGDGSGGRGGVRSSGHRESAAFRKMTLTIDADESYDKGLQYESLINPANNVDMSVQLPVSDIPAIPNDRLLYALYFLNAEGAPTRIWHTEGRSDYDTLVGHIVQGALRYKQLPSRRITGEIFTGLHLDMNTVVRDDKYLKAGYYVNSIELDALQDSYNSELVEMPKLIAADAPPEGDDCVTAAELPATVEQVIRSLNLLLIRSGRRVYAFDAATGRTREIYAHTRDFEIYPADEGFVAVDGSTIHYLDYRGTVRQIYTPDEEYRGLSTYLDGYFYLLKEYRQYIGPRSIRAAANETAAETGYRYYHYLYRPEYVFETEDDNSYRRGSGISGTSMQGDIREMLRTANTIVVNTSQYACLHDKRFHKPCYMQTFEIGTRIVTVSDSYLGVNLDDAFLIYRRDSITERTLIHRAGRCADYADHTMSEFAHCYDDAISVWNFRDNTTHGVQNKAGAGQMIRGLYYILGELYIVRERTIYKYIP
jgi:hypothetical protein|nr:MAG TPA: Structural protein [Caudoviricetes sp.]